jgi:uncharacterized protein
MKKRVFAFLTALLIVTGCPGYIGYAGASGEAAVLQPVTAMAAATGSNGSNRTDGTNGTYGTDGTNRTNGTTGTAQAPGTLLVVDDARLLSEEEEARLIADYSAITEYMGAAFISTYSSPGTTAYFAEQCAIKYFRDDPAVLFLIDMDDREIYVYANGKAQETISRADARAITDNIYKSASRGEYFNCADEAFNQIYTKCEGGRLARPVKHITNALIAVLLGILINYLITVISRITASSRRTRGDVNVSVTRKMAAMPGIALAVPIVLSSVKRRKSSSRSGGGGGGGGGHSGGGGGHSF